MSGPVSASEPFSTSERCSASELFLSSGLFSASELPALPPEESSAERSGGGPSGTEDERRWECPPLHPQLIGWPQVPQQGCVALSSS